MRHLCALLFVLSAPLACHTSSGEGDSCQGKCDTPGDTANAECEKRCQGDADCFDECREEMSLAFCEARRDDAVASAQRAFVKDAVRWSCADVEGVNTVGGDDRGQEYCEYFAVVQAPPLKEGDALPKSQAFGRSSQELGFELTDDQLFALEDEAERVVGQCVFSSWHQDVRDELPICADGDCELEVAQDALLPSWASGIGLGYQLTGENTRMEISINSNGAAVDLIERCVDNIEPVKDEQDPRNDHYMRGCMHTANLFGTEWRRSDPTICTAAMRLSECGCGVDTDGDGKADITDFSEIARAIVPRQPQIIDGEPVFTLRGFKLGTWSGATELPTGCRYVEIGEDTQVVVSCDLTAADLITSAADPKARCREKYGDNVVVHIPIPSEAVVCEPDPDAPFTDSCGDRPWEVGNEGQSGPGGGECCKICDASQACGDSCIPATSTCNQDPGCACEAEDE